MTYSRPLFGVLGLVGLFLLIAAVYWPGLSSGFILDDHQNILNNGDIQIDRITAGNLIQATAAYGGGLIGRPLSTVSLALNYAISGLDPKAYNLTNLGLHILNASLVSVLLLTLLRAAGLGWRTGLGLMALVGALLWAIHPLQVSTVLYAVQRMEILAASFTLLALLSYLHGRRVQIRGQEGGWPWVIMAGALALLAFSSKETGALIPFYALAIEVFLLRFQASNQRDRQLLLAGFAGVLIMSLIGYLFWVLPSALEPGRFLARDFTAGERVLTQFRMLPMYLGLIVWPAPDRMLFYYDHIAPSTGLFRPLTTFLGFLLLLSLAALMVFLRHRLPLVALGIAWFFIGHAITSNVFSLELAFEHRNYLPLLGIVIAFTGLIYRSLDKFALSRIIPLLGIGALAAMAIMTGLLAATWGENNRLAVHHAEINPASERATLELGFAYLEAADGDPNSPWHEQAIEAFKRAASRPRSTPVPEQNLILLAARSGQPAKATWWQDFHEKLRTQPVGAGYRTAVQNLLRNRFRGAEVNDFQLQQVHQTLLRREGIPPRLHAEFGYYFLETVGLHADAISAFSRALELIGDDQEARASLLRSLETRGHGDLVKQLKNEFLFPTSAQTSGG